MDKEFQSNVKNYKLLAVQDLEEKIIENSDESAPAKLKQRSSYERSILNYLEEKHTPDSIYLSHSNTRVPYEFESFEMFNHAIQLSYRRKQNKPDQFPEKITITKNGSITVEPLRNNISLPNSQSDSLAKYFNKPELKLLQ